MDFEFLKKEVKQMNCKVRTSSHKASIRGDYDKEEHLSFTRKKHGKVEVKWMMRVPIKSNERMKCDLGHFHDIEQDQHWVWNYCTLSADDVEKLREFFV